MLDWLEQISIHALREEGDDLELSLVEAMTEISIHALREEGDCRPLWKSWADM